MKRLLLLLFLALPVLSAAVSAPAGLSNGLIRPDGSLIVYWTQDTLPSQWYIYLNGTLTYAPYRAQTTLTGSQLSFQMPNFPVGTAISLTMTAIAPGPIYSSSSSPLIINSTITQILYVLNPTGTPIAVTGNMSATASITGTVAVTQDSPWTVSGSVSIIQGGPLSVSVLATTDYKSVSVGAWNAGYLGISVTSWPNSFAGVSASVINTAGSPVNTTFTSSVVPATPATWDEAAPRYVYGAETNTAKGATIVVTEHLRYIDYLSLPLGVTCATATFNTGYVFLTMSAHTKTTVVYADSNTSTAYIYFSLGTSLPTTSNTFRIPVNPGDKYFIEDEPFTYIWAWNPTGPAIQPLEIIHQYGVPIPGTTYY